MQLLITHIYMRDLVEGDPTHETVSIFLLCVSLDFVVINKNTPMIFYTHSVAHMQSHSLLVY